MSNKQGTPVTLTKQGSFQVYASCSANYDNRRRYEPNIPCAQHKSLLGHYPHNPPMFRCSVPDPLISITGTPYFVEIKRHRRALHPPTFDICSGDSAAGKRYQKNHRLVKQVLSRGLRLCFCCLPPPRIKPGGRQRLRISHDARLHPHLLYPVRLVADGTLRTGARTEAYGRVRGVAPDLISAPLDNSMLFVEPHASRPWAVLQLLKSTLTAAPTVFPSPVYLTAFIATAQTPDPPTRLSCTNGFTPLDAFYTGLFNLPPVLVSTGKG